MVFTIYFYFFFLLLLSPSSNLFGHVSRVSLSIEFKQTRSVTTINPPWINHSLLHKQSLLSIIYIQKPGCWFHGSLAKPSCKLTRENTTYSDQLIYFFSFIHVQIIHSYVHTEKTYRFQDKQIPKWNPKKEEGEEEEEEMQNVKFWRGCNNPKE